MCSVRLLQFVSFVRFKNFGADFSARTILIESRTAHIIFRYVQLPYGKFPLNIFANAKKT